MISGRECYREQLHSLRLEPLACRSLPSARLVAGLLESAKELLFPEAANEPVNEPGPTDRPDLEQSLQSFRQALADQIQLAFAYRGDEQSSDSEDSARTISMRLVGQLSGIQTALRKDVQAAYDGDPSLQSHEEAILCFPGITAMICYRLAHALQLMGVPLIPRMMTEHAHSVTGIDIHPEAKIGERLFIDHGTGVVIGATAVIGDRVRIYQGVTLGSKSFRAMSNGRLVKGEPRHPILEDDVVVYSGASILGRITIGRGSVIGGNVWVTRDVSPGSLVTQAQVKSSEYSNGAGI